MGMLLYFLFGSTGSYAQISPLDLANEMMTTVGFWIIIGVIVWSIISYTLGSKMIMAFAGAKPIEKRECPELYRAVENASIAAGLPKTPDIYIIEDHSLNAFATGTNPKNAKVAISRGLLGKLNKGELEAVMAHEIGHILNSDIKVMLVAITLVGAVQMVGEIMLRSGYASSSDNKNANVLPIIGFLFVTVGALVGTLTKFAISREREYLADATSAQLTSNPMALASALEKIAGDARLEILDGKASMAGLCIADPTQDGHQHHVSALDKMNGMKEDQKTSFWVRAWSSHPPVNERIARLKGY